jgi:hypothetical protein
MACSYPAGGGRTRRPPVRLGGVAGQVRNRSGTRPAARAGPGGRQHLRPPAAGARLRLIGFTDGLRIEAVAEGVETAAQAERLHRAGYPYAQGFHFARPMPAAAIDHLLRARRTIGPAPVI